MRVYSRKGQRQGGRGTEDTCQHRVGDTFVPGKEGEQELLGQGYVYCGINRGQKLHTCPVPMRLCPRGDVSLSHDVHLPPHKDEHYLLLTWNKGFKGTQV